jgi:hypothetical protein
MQVTKLFAKQFCHLCRVKIFTDAHSYKTHSTSIVHVVQKIWFYTHANPKYKIAFLYVLIP